MADKWLDRLLASVLQALGGKSFKNKPLQAFGHSKIHYFTAGAQLSIAVAPA